MPRPEPLRVLEEADLLITAAVAGKWPLPRIENEWRKFVATVERRYEPEKFAQHFARDVVYQVREVKDIDEKKPANGQSEQPNGDAPASMP